MVPKKNAPKPVATRPATLTGRLLGMLGLDKPVEEKPLDDKHKEFTGKEGLRTYDGHTFAVHPTGAFVRTDKDRRPVKERKAARRALQQ